MSEYNVSSLSTETIIIQLPPPTIPLYSIYESDLMVIAKGADSISLQISIAAFGAALGASPAAYGALGNVYAGKVIDGAALFAVAVAFCGVITGIALAFVHHRHKTYPEKLLAKILARNKEVAA